MPIKSSALTTKAIRWLIRLVLVPHLLVAAHFANRFVDYPDQDAYLSTAENILAGHGLSLSFDALGGFVRKGEPTSYYGLGTPLFLAGQIALVSHNSFLLQLVIILLFALSFLLFSGICILSLSDLFTIFAS